MSDKENNFEEQEASVVGSEESSEVGKQNGNLKDLLQQIKDLQDQVEKQKDNYVRSMADFDNYRRRMVRELEEMRKNAAFSLIEDLLPILDNLSLGLEAAKKGESVSEIVQGFQMVFDQFKAILIDNGVHELNPEGAFFDHNEHECVSLIGSMEVEANKVISVVRLGYRLNGRLLRPASVIVSSGLANNSETVK